MKIFIRFFLLFLFLCKYHPSLAEKQFVILKADDFRNAKGSVSPSFLNFINIIKRKNIKAALGLVSQDLENPTPEYISLIKNLNNSGRFEFFNHGYTHRFGVRDAQGQILYAEFFKQTFDYQYKNLNDAQNIMKEKTGITMRSFGAPGNRVDSNTAKAIKSQGEIKVWLYSKKNITIPNGVLGLPVRTNIEWNKTPDLQRFKNEYDANKPYLLLQFHPQNYSPSKLATLEKSIDFLITKGVEFILPYDYFCRVNNIPNGFTKE